MTRPPILLRRLLTFLPPHPASMSAAYNAITIGNFDGLHRGHQELFRALDCGVVERAAAGQATWKSLVTFYPHPRWKLQGKHFRDCLGVETCHVISLLREKLRLAAQFGFQEVVLIHFSPQFGALSPEAFVRDYVIGQFRAQLVVVGDDWGFGRGRAATANSLQDFGNALGFEVVVVPGLDDGGERISAHRIRKEIRDGDMATVKRLLGRPYRMIGKVVHGEARGRALGFPTANVKTRFQVVPSTGVYAVRANFQGKIFGGVCNIGTRPTFAGKEVSIEVHLLDYQGAEFYGELLEIDFLRKLREEKKFSSVESLKAAITVDCNDARSIFGQETDDLGKR